MRRVILPLLLLISAQAAAKPITYEWEGRVSNPAWKVALGDMVRGTLTVDEDGPLEPEFSDDSQKVYYAAHFTLTAAGRQFASQPQGLNSKGAWDWNISNYGQVANNVIMEGGSLSYVSFGFFAQTRFGNLDLLAANNLDQSWISGGWGIEVRDPLNEDVGLENFYGDVTKITRLPGGDATPVPEPSSLMMMGSAITAVGVARRRRRGR